ncbi:hypothetical protein DPMN_122078 [Dreissena polymorpha]|uniref:Uncharacterized protein n=1 Tax=Dreissena polymorpha TaxID=45954 RepID=A0A9D4GNZ4_DREPO|nr:hypothetical protein DPMN_122078 [Dreissena polymorpha]
MVQEGLHLSQVSLCTLWYMLQGELHLSQVSLCSQVSQTSLTSQVSDSGLGQFSSSGRYIFI